MAESQTVRSLSAIQRLLGDIRLAILAAVAVLGVDAPESQLRLVVILAGLSAVWLNRLPTGASDGRPHHVLWAWLLTGLDLLAATLVLAIIGPDSLALVYVAMTAATAAIRLGLAGALLASGVVILVHVVALFSDGSEVQWAVVLVVFVRLALVTLTAVATARLRDLLLTHATLSEQVQNLRERQAGADERTRLARDLHDSLAKTLHGATLLAGRLRRRLELEASALSADAELVETSLRIAQQEGRDILASLRQEPVRDLRSALVDLIEQWQVTSGVAVEMRLPAAEPDVNPDGKAELVKAVAEILENVKRHAHASQVTVTLEHSQEHVRVTVVDDGIGMPPPDLALLAATGHFGMVGLHERMAGIGGHVEVRPAQPRAQPAPGTRVELVVLLRPGVSHRVGPAGSGRAELRGVR